MVNKCTEAEYCHRISMGIDVDTWRRRIGSFSQPYKGKFPLRTLKMKSLSLCIRVCLFFLLVMQGVETNPGPGTGPGGLGSGSGSGSGSGPGRSGSSSGQRNSTSAFNKQLRGRGQPGSGRGGGRGSPAYDKSHPISDRVLRSADSSQNVMSSWLNSDRRSSGYGYNPQSETRSESSGLYDDDNGDVDIKTVLLEIRREVRKTNTKFDSLEQQVTDLKTGHENLKLEHDELKTSNENLKTENETLSKQVNNLSKKLDQLENQMRRENLVFHGISEDPDENWQDSESKIRTYVCDDLGIDESSISIERAHHLKTKTFPRPIIAKFTMFKDSDRILKSYL